MDLCWVSKDYDSSCSHFSSGPISLSERRDCLVFCPKPRRIGQLVGRGDERIKPPGLHPSYRVDPTDLSASSEVFHLFPTNNSCGSLDSLAGSLFSSSPPYFCGSPPSRTTNPIVQDARFLRHKQNTLLTPPSSPSNGVKNASCVHPSIKFGSNQATVKIEGFDCLNGDRRGHGIPATA